MKHIHKLGFPDFSQGSSCPVSSDKAEGLQVQRQLAGYDERLALQTAPRGNAMTLPATTAPELGRAGVRPTLSSCLRGGKETGGSGVRNVGFHHQNQTARIPSRICRNVVLEYLCLTTQSKF